MKKCIEKIVKFIENYANKVSIPLPCRLPQIRNFEKVVKLPSCDITLSIYRKFVDAANNDEEIRIVSQSYFLRISNQNCPEIMTMKPASDLCNTCREIHLKLAKLSKVPTEEQDTILEEAKNHLNVARIQREFYNSLEKLLKIIIHFRSWLYLLITPKISPTLVVRNKLEPPISH